MRTIVAAISLLALMGCGQDVITLKACPAVAAAADAPAPDGWQVVTFAGGLHAASRTYHVREKPLFTEWNLVGARAAMGFR